MKVLSDVVFKAFSIVVPVFMIFYLKVYNIFGIALLVLPYLIIFILSCRKQRTNKALFVSNSVLLILILALSAVMVFGDAQSAVGIFILMVLQLLISGIFLTAKLCMEAFKGNAPKEL